jgi:hypothetical protein
MGTKETSSILIWHIIKGVFEAIIVEVVKWSLFSIIILLIGVFYYFSKRRRLNGFFGISKKNNKLKVYLSSLFIQLGGAVDSNNSPRSYMGIALPDKEFRGAFAILDTFKLNILEDFVSRLLKKVILLSTEIEILPAPRQQKDIVFDNIISVGGPAFNEVTKYYLNNNDAYFRFVDDNRSIEINRGGQKGQLIEAASNDVGFVLKLYDSNYKIVVFITAGLGTNGTRGALKYLFDNWEELKGKSNNKDFGVCLSFPFEYQDYNGYLRPKKLIEIYDSHYKYR